MSIEVTKFRMELYAFFKNKLKDGEPDDLLTMTTILADSVMFNLAFIFYSRQLPIAEYPLKLAEFFKLIEEMFYSSMEDIKKGDSIHKRSQ